MATQLAAQPRPHERHLATAYDTARRWLASEQASSLSHDRPPPVFGRNDHNLANFLWDGRQVRLVDFEDCGSTDRAVELAALVEHLSARGTPNTTWADLIDMLELTGEEHGRLRAARRLYAAYWLCMLLPGQPAADRNPPHVPRRQAERLLALT